MNNELLQITRDHSWNYFSLHAQQRISVFQYYITIETALITAAIISIQYKNDLNNPKWAIFLSPMIVLFSFIFWKIDQRTRELIQKSELSLRQIELIIKNNINIKITLPFTEDPQNNPNIFLRNFLFFPGRLSYSQSFGVIYLTCASFGLILSFAMYNAFFTADSKVALFKTEPKDTLRFEQRHQDIIERFGRYPQRNAILGRASTPEALAFLSEPGLGFSPRSLAFRCDPSHINGFDTGINVLER